MNKVIRWLPRADLPELPLSAFDMTWTAERTLTCHGYYGVVVPDEYRGLRIQFEDVHAFASFDGFSDPLISYQTGLLPLRETVPYGGSWPFVEVLNSSWTSEIANAHGAFPIEYWRHLAVTAFDQTLHVMAHRESDPRTEFWLHPEHIEHSDG